MFPGYVLLNMVMNDDTWYVVRNTRGVTGFVGPGSKPVPLKMCIRDRYKNEDYMTLEKVFRPYYQMMQKSLEKGEICAEDIEILDIYTDVLEKTCLLYTSRSHIHRPLTWMRRAEAQMQTDRRASVLSLIHI